MSNPKEILKETIDGMIVREIFKQMMMREGLLVERTAVEGGEESTTKIEIDPQILNRLVRNLKKTGEFEGQRAYGVTADEVYATEGAPPKTNYSFISENLNNLIPDKKVDTEWQNHPFTVIKKAQMFLENPSEHTQAGLKDSLSVFLLCDMLTSLFDTSKYDEDVAGKLFEYIVSGLSGGWVPRGSPLEDIYFEGKGGEKIGYSLKRIIGNTIEGSLVNLYDALIRNPDGIEYLFIKSEGDKVSLQKSAQITQDDFQRFLKTQYEEFKKKSKSKSPKRDSLNEEQASPTEPPEIAETDGNPPFTPIEILAISQIKDDVEFFNALKRELGDSEGKERLINYFLASKNQKAMNSVMKAITSIEARLEKIIKSGVKQDTYKVNSFMGTVARSYYEDYISKLSGGTGEKGKKAFYNKQTEEIEKYFPKENRGFVELDYESVKKLKDLVEKLQDESAKGVAGVERLWKSLYDGSDFKQHYEKKWSEKGQEHKPITWEAYQNLFEKIINNERIEKEIPEDDIKEVLKVFNRYIYAAREYYSPARVPDPSTKEEDPTNDFDVDKIFDYDLGREGTQIINLNKKIIRKILSATGNTKIQKIIDAFDDLKENFIAATITIDLSKLEKPYTQARSGFEDDLRSFIEGLSETFKHLDVFFERYLDFVKDGGHRKFQSLGGDSLFRAYSAMDNTFYKRKDPDQLDLFSSQPDQQP